MHAECTSHWWHDGPGQKSQSDYQCSGPISVRQPSMWKAPSAVLKEPNKETRWLGRTARMREGLKSEPRPREWKSSGSGHLMLEISLPRDDDLSQASTLGKHGPTRKTPQPNIQGSENYVKQIERAPQPKREIYRNMCYLNLIGFRLWSPRNLVWHNFPNPVDFAL